ncbi:MAG: DUF3137 domain-containing protein [Hoeflea sp.]|uniref:DUF3137 domain-containing protein n=1 Tax=Hoeflea sp. TaxID=1940281 RepID=UPI0032EBA8D6
MDDPSRPAPASAEGFDAYFDLTVQPLLDALEAKRAKRIRLIVILLATGLAFFAVILFQAITRQNQASGLFDNQAVGLGVFALMFGPLVAAFLMYRGLTQAFKEVLTGRICEFYGFDHRMGGFDFPLERFDALLPPYGQAKLEDRIAGKHKGLGFELCEVALTRRSAKSDTKNKTAFTGVLLAVDCHRRFEGETVLTPDWGPKGNLVERLRQQGERVQFEGIVFENAFEVYSTDQLEARYLLSPLMMERIVGFADNLGNGRGIGLAFSQGQLLLAVRRRRGAGRFEAGHLFARVDNWRERAERVSGEIHAVLQIVDALRLEKD